MAEKQVTEARVKELIAGEVKILLADVEKRFAASLAAALEGLVTKTEVSDDLQKIIENLKNFVTIDALGEHLSELITKDQWNEALDGMLTASTPVTLTGIHPGFASGLTLLEPIAAEWLKGLVFRSARTKKTEAGTVNHPTERPLTPGDVLSWNDNGDTVSFVTADGQKYTVDKE